MYCNRCGALVKDNAAFCAKCGNRLNYQSLSPNQSSPPYQNPAQNQGSPPYQNSAPGQSHAPGSSYTYEPPRRRKSNAAAITFSIIGFLIFAVMMVIVIRAFSDGSYIIARPDTPSYAAVSAPQAPSATKTPDATEESTEPTYSDSELIDYFCQVALNVEYGSNGNNVLKRWKKSIRVKVSGDYTTEDYTTLTNHIDTLNGLGILPKISIVNSDANFFIYFVPLDDMDDVIPGYTEGNWGYFYLYWSSKYVLNKAYMGIATDVTTQEARNHLILEEFTQALGLMNDSYDYEDSIFQAKWTTTQSLAPIDYMLLYMLYSDYLEPGMGTNEVRRVLNDRLDDMLPPED